MSETSGATAAQMPTLLIVDDQPINVRAMHSAFASDYRVLMATGGVDALRICRESLPDLILLDVVMPDLGGHEVCRQLKADPRTCDIPIIFVTAQDEPSQEMLGLQLGAVDFIGKPVNPAVIRARVRTHLDLRRTSRKLASLNESLEVRIADRTRDLEVALKAADLANRTKSQFLSNMSHEILTPINGVVGMAYLALRADPDPTLRGYLDKISASGQHLLEVVEDILDFSRLVSSEVVLENIEFELADVMSGVASQTSADASAKGLELSFEVDPTLEGMFLGDPLRIGQVLIHYVANAIKFSVSGRIRVAAARLSSVDDFDEVRIEVRDDGVGMHPSDLAGLFQPFHQVDASFSRRFGGNGLGLATCKEVAKLMGGEVGVNSAPGAGSTFWFTVKLARAQLSPQPRAREASAHAPADPLRGARVLVAEDNLINRELAVGLLQAVGVLVDAVEDGRQAVEQGRQVAYDCILMDVQMPLMDGIEATRRLRADPSVRRIPILALTANVGREDRARCIACGMDDVVAKPVNPDTLYATLRKWLPMATGCPTHVDADEPTRSVLTSDVETAVDLRILEKSVGGDPIRFRRFATLFIESVSGTLAELDQALAAGDMGKLSDLGHRLKSSSSMVGALGFAAMCQRLEDMRDDATLLQARKVVDQMPAILAMVSAELAKGLL